MKIPIQVRVMSNSIARKLHGKGCIEAPDFVIPNLMYETKTGSVAYGVATDSSDTDVVGFTVPPKEMVFPHLIGEIQGFGTQKSRFKQSQDHGIVHDGVEYDVNIYSIVRFFHLAMDNNPNMIELLFTPGDCVTLSTPISEYVRENRRIFLHKGAYHRFRGFSYSQISKMRKRDREEERLIKYAYHAVRLLLEAEQILKERDLTLDTNSETLKRVRNGDWGFDRVSEFFDEKESELDELYETSEALPYSPDEERIKGILLDCLEMHYGSLDGCIKLG